MKWKTPYTRKFLNFLARNLFVFFSVFFLCWVSVSVCVSWSWCHPEWYYGCDSEYCLPQLLLCCKYDCFSIGLWLFFLSMYESLSLHVLVSLSSVCFCVFFFSFSVSIYLCLTECVSDSLLLCRTMSIALCHFLFLYLFYCLCVCITWYFCVVFRLLSCLSVFIFLSLCVCVSTI